MIKYRLLYQKSLIIVLGITCVWQTIMPFVTTVDDNRGYSILWFVALYVIGGYLKKFGIDVKLSKMKLLLIYVICAGAQFIYTLFWNVVQGKTGIIINIPYYNSIFVLIEAIALLIVFLRIDFGKK